MTAGSEPISVWGNTTPSFMSYSSSIVGSRRAAHPHRRSGRTIMPPRRRVKVGQVGYCVGMAFWLLKSEPDEWSWTEQVAKGRDGAEWTGIRNFSAPTDSGWSAVDVAAVRQLPRPVGLDRIKANRHLTGMALVRLPRLSVQPVREAEWRILSRMGGLGLTRAAPG